MTALAAGLISLCLAMLMLMLIVLHWRLERRVRRLERRR